MREPRLDSRTNHRPFTSPAKCGVFFAQGTRARGFCVLPSGMCDTKVSKARRGKRSSGTCAARKQTATPAGPKTSNHITPRPDTAGQWDMSAAITRCRGMRGKFIYSAVAATERDKESRQFINLGFFENMVRALSRNLSVADIKLIPSKTGKR